MKRRILCYGDSNTWGYDPMGGRYDEDARWPRVMAEWLGDEFDVIEEGFNGRTFSQDDPTEGGYKSGAVYLPPCLMTHNPLELVIVMLGTNDTKRRFGLNAATIARNLEEFVRLTRSYAIDEAGKAPKILIVSPPLIGDWIDQTLMVDHFGADAPEKSRGFASAYHKYALLLKCDFLDAALYTTCSKVDAIHLTRDAQKALGRAMYEKVKTLLR